MARSNQKKEVSFLDWIPGVAGSLFREGSYAQGAGREFVERAIEKIKWNEVQDGKGLMGRLANIFLAAREKLGPTGSILFFEGLSEIVESVGKTTPPHIRPLFRIAATLIAASGSADLGEAEDHEVRDHFHRIGQQIDATMQGVPVPPDQGGAMRTQNAPEAEEKKPYYELPEFTKERERAFFLWMRLLELDNKYDKFDMHGRSNMLAARTVSALHQAPIVVARLPRYSSRTYKEYRDIIDWIVAHERSDYKAAFDTKIKQLRKLERAFESFKSIIETIEIDESALKKLAGPINRFKDFIDELSSHEDRSHVFKQAKRFSKETLWWIGLGLIAATVSVGLSGLVLGAIGAISRLAMIAGASSGIPPYVTTVIGLVVTVPSVIIAAITKWRVGTMGFTQAVFTLTATFTLLLFALADFIGWIYVDLFNMHDQVVSWDAYYMVLQTMAAIYYLPFTLFVVKQMDLVANDPYADKPSGIFPFVTESLAAGKPNWEALNRHGNPFRIVRKPGVKFGAIMNLVAWLAIVIPCVLLLLQNGGPLGVWLMAIIGCIVPAADLFRWHGDKFSEKELRSLGKVAAGLGFILLIGVLPFSFLGYTASSLPSWQIASVLIACSIGLALFGPKNNQQVRMIAGLLGVISLTMLLVSYNQGELTNSGADSAFVQTVPQSSSTGTRAEKKQDAIKDARQSVEEKICKRMLAKGFKRDQVDSCQ